MYQILDETLRGQWEPASAPIEARREAILQAFTEVAAFTLEPKLKVNPEAMLIAPALGRPYDPKEKSVYAAIVNALGLMIDRIAPNQKGEPVKKIQVNSNFDARAPFPHRW